jgi:hypothetical protein
MPTLEGIIFVPLAIYFFFRHPDRLFPLLVISTVFEASSIVSSGPIGIQPYYVVAVLFILQAIIRRPALFAGGGSRIVPFWTLAAFLIVGVSSAVLLPVLFAGIPVYDPRLGIDAGLLYRPPLHLQPGNFAQAILLTINILMVIAAASAGPALERTHKAFIAALYITAGIVIVQFAFFATGLPFPTFLLNNNPGYGIVNQSIHQLRPNGSFTEPSMAGAALAAFAGASLSMYLDHRRGIAAGALASLACLLVASSSSLVALTLLVILLMFSQRVIRWPWYIMLTPLRRMSVFVLAGLLSASLLLVPSVRNMVIAQTINKGSSVSALVRFTADFYSLSLLAKTHGLGVGLGSNRPSSLITSVLSQVGVAGFILFAVAVLQILSKIPQQHRWIFWSSIGLLLAMCLGVPDLSYPLLWILLAMAVQSKAPRYGRKTQSAIHRTQKDRPCVPRAALPSKSGGIGDEGISARMAPSQYAGDLPGNILGRMWIAVNRRIAENLWQRRCT